VENNRRVHWHPEHIGEGRFGNWLENVVDWALSRKRYWGTPLPIWRCDNAGGDSSPAASRGGACTHAECIGSYAELFAKTGEPMPADVLDQSQFDPHRPTIDAKSWPCAACGKGTMRRVDDVIDAWFDSGAMPFAQHHYMGSRCPTSTRRQGLRGFPAHFISEASTRRAAGSTRSTRSAVCSSTRSLPAMRRAWDT
jgi:isoleucyl-tRNA synthetase